MSNKLLSTDEVLKRIGAQDFRSISRDQLVEFVSSIPDMDKEVAIKCIEQFPEFREHSKIIVEELSALCDKAVTEHKNIQIESINAYKGILDDLSDMLKIDTITDEQRDTIIDRMIEVADKIQNVSQSNTKFLENVLRVAGTVAAIAIGVGGTLLGMKITKHD